MDHLELKARACAQFDIIRCYSDECCNFKVSDRLNRYNLSEDDLTKAQQIYEHSLAEMMLYLLQFIAATKDYGIENSIQNVRLKLRNPAQISSHDLGICYRELDQLAAHSQHLRGLIDLTKRQLQ